MLKQAIRVRLFVTALVFFGSGAFAPAFADENAKAQEFFALAFSEKLAFSPILQAYMGIKDQYGEWDDLSEARAWERLAQTQAQMKALRSTIDRDALDEQNALSYELFVEESRRYIDSFPWRHYGYPVNQMHGVQAETPAFLINIHRIESIEDAHSYIQRLDGLPAYFAQVEDGLRLRAARGILPPRFVFPYVLSDCRNVISGAPFEAGAEDSTLLADFRGKVTALELGPDEQKALIADAERALRNSVAPAYESLIRRLESLEPLASTDDGAWKFPRGSEFYRVALRNMTTTDLAPEQIHRTGLDEVARIHAEMREIKKAVGFDGDLQAFFAFLREDPRFYFEDSEAGRQAYLQRATDLIDVMRSRLDEFFGIQPKATMEVRRVEAFRERSAGKAFYQRPSPDGARPGVYYANLYRITDMPTYQMEALAYHEGLPGHHLQIAIALELEGVPDFRKWGFYTAYSEGWGLYSEYFPKEFGFYADPYSDFGRLAMELWRACRLVVDTGIHEMRWTREQAIEYLAENTPNPRGDIVKAIERYVVMPGQATAYKIGQLRILALRERAREALGERFSLPEFHDLVLSSGPIPLTLLERRVDEWIEK